jgi:Tfp pilus assembly protein PilO
MILKGKNIKTKERIAALTLFFLIFMGGLIYFSIYLPLKDIDAIKNDIIKEQIAIEQKLYEDQNKAIIQSKLNKIEPLMGALNSVFVDKSRAIEFFTSLEDLARRHNIKQTISLAETGGEKSSSFFVKTPINIKCEGEYLNLFGFLAGLEESGYYINIEQLSINKSASARRTDVEDGSFPTAPILTMNIAAQTYWKN